MKHSDYKRVVDQIKPDAALEARLAKKLQSKTRRKRFRPAAIVAACMVLALLLGVWVIRSNEENHILENIVAEDGTVVIPQIKLPKKMKGSADMIGLIVYQGRIYTQSGTSIAVGDAKPLLGTKIGRTKPSINEWSKQSDYAEELASSVGNRDVYTVKGYDSSFRIMTYDEENGEVRAEIYECMNGITLRSGADLFGQLKLTNQLDSATWERFGNWDQNTKEHNVLAVNDTLEAFLLAMYDSKPIAQQTLQSQGIFDNGEQTQKFIYLQLKDKSVVELRLFKDGYVMYSFSHVFFKMEDAVFTALWNDLA